MADKISPPSKPVAKSDGLKQGAANTTLTTPNHSDNRYWSEGKNEKSSIFGK